MMSLQKLEEKIQSLATKRLRDYQKIAGEYVYPGFVLYMDTIPPDPDKTPVRARIRARIADTDLPKVIFKTKEGEIAARDFITREFSDKTVAASQKKHGNGKFYIDKPGRDMLETSSVVVDDGLIEVRFSIDLPHDKGNIPTYELTELLLKRLPRMVRGSMFFKNIDSEKLTKWIEVYQDAEALRKSLDAAGLVAFVADGSVIEGIRREEDSRKAFKAPDDLAVTLTAPNRGEIRGMGIPKGLTVIAGWANSGKTTLLTALSYGVYNHLPGDGREYIVTAHDAMFVQTEEGRRVENVDISPFFSGTLNHHKSEEYRIKRARMFDSQAASVMEAVEIGTSLLLLDEDSSSPALIGTDMRMDALMGEEGNPVTTLVDVLPELRDSLNISTVIALSSNGAYLGCADTVIRFDDEYKASNISEEAKRIAAETPSPEPRGATLQKPRGRQPLRATLDPMEQKTKDKIRPRGIGYVQYGDEFIDMEKVPQLSSSSQARGIARGLSLLHRLLDRSRTLSDAVDEVVRRVNTVGLDTLSNRCMGDLAVFRRQELAAAVNRLQDLKMR